jgi:hypothetical protein
MKGCFTAIVVVIALVVGLALLIGGIAVAF